MFHIILWAHWTKKQRQSLLQTSERCLIGFRDQRKVGAVKLHDIDRRSMVTVAGFRPKNGNSVYVEHLPPTPPNTKPLVLFKYMPVGEDFGQVLEYLKVGLNFAKGLLFLERVDEYTSVIHVRPGIVGVNFNTWHNG
jgi:hypothetical protein